MQCLCSQFTISQNLSLQSQARPTGKSMLVMLEYNNFHATNQQRENALEKITRKKAADFFSILMFFVEKKN